MSEGNYISTESAIRQLRADPCCADLIRDTYLDTNTLAAAARFAESGEWTAVRNLLGSSLLGARVIDLGAGNGMASRALILAGAASVKAVEPDPSDEIGRGAIARVCAGLPVEAVVGWGEQLPLPDKSADLVFVRQVLHHTRDLPRTLRECARVLRPGGQFLACREHVAETPQELTSFLAAHPVHQLTGSEHAYRLGEYSLGLSHKSLPHDQKRL
jgi:ubiquinone/menaquinone biosynthesis C-methylase UbiE